MTDSHRDRMLRGDLYQADGPELSRRSVPPPQSSAGASTPSRRSRLASPVPSWGSSFVHSANGAKFARPSPATTAAPVPSPRGTSP